MTSPPLRARRDMMSQVEFPGRWVPLPFERRFTVSEYERMALGVVPGDMEDKWCIYLEDETFYFHRSWTGRCIFRMQIQKMGEGFVVSEAAVARYPLPSDSPPEHTDAWLSEEARLLTLLVDVLLLGKPDPRPYPGEGRVA